MMQKKLPSTPAEALDISSNKLRFKMETVVQCAEMFGFWKNPYKEAATSFEEMVLMDIYYWVYKSKNPIARVEKGETAGDLFLRDQSIVKLPKGFEKQSSVTFGAGGDLLRSRGIEHSEGILFENVADLLFDQTISYTNLESPITTQELQEEVIGDRAAPIECCSPEQFNILKGHKGKNFNVMNTTNNHTFDMGVEGIETTQKVFEKEGILNVGVNKTPDEYGKGKILVKDGIKIGFVADTFGLNGHQVPESESYRINVSKLLSKFVDPDLALLKKQIDHCKEEGCDFIIASMHWGYEFEFFPRKRQVEAARALVEYGADTIICHHPHVIQPVEYYRTQRDPDRVAVIAYSMGSLTWGFTAPHIALSIILNLRISKGSIAGKELTYIEDAEVTPVFRSVTEDSEGKTITRIERLVSHLNGAKDTHPRSYIEKMKQYADLVLGEYSLSRKSAEPLTEDEPAQLAA